MLKALCAGALAWLIALTLPMAVLYPDTVPVRAPEASGTPETAASEAAGEISAASAAPAAAVPDASAPKEAAPGDEMLISVETDGQCAEMPLADYLAGVLGGEMPVSWPEAALEAQVIAARTMVYRKLTGESAHETGAPVCTDPGHCMAYAPLSDFTPDEQAVLRAAVAATADIIAVWEDEPILAVFHAVSGGRTEAAADVWGGDMPYLCGVESPGEEGDAMFRTEHRFPFSDFAGRILAEYPAADLTGDPAGWITDIDRSPAGGVRSASVGGVRIRGTVLRRLLALPSTDFTIRADADGLTLVCTGWGHGVGMSQAGAAAMARAGSSAEEIVEYYYPGAVCRSAG